MKISDEELELFKDWKPGQVITIDQVSIGLLIQEARESRSLVTEILQALKLQATREQDGLCFCDIPAGHQFLSHEPWCKAARSVIAKVAKSVMTHKGKSVISWTLGEPTETFTVCDKCGVELNDENENEICDEID